ncbi:MAG: GyrI-like domain-containing protein [bacterium]
MKDDVEIIEKEKEFTLEIAAKTTMPKLPGTIKNSYIKITDYMPKVNVKPTEPPFVRYTNLNWEELNKQNKFIGFLKIFTQKWDMLVGFPVKNNLPGEGEIVAGYIPAGRYVKAFHKGPYHKVGDTYKKMIAFIEKENLKYGDECIEYYLNDPKSTKKEDLETIVMIPIKD